MKKLEEEYLKKNNRYNLERELLSTMWKEELKTFIFDKKSEEIYHKDNLVKYMKKLVNKPWYKSFDELQKAYFEWIVYIKAWWKELEETRDILKNFQYLYDLKFTNKNIFNNIKVITKDIIEKVKQINIENVLVKYTDLKINYQKACKCPLHNDNRASFQIYPHTNSFYCYWCSVWWTPIEFTAKLFNLTNKEAINKLKTDFFYI